MPACWTCVMKLGLAPNVDCSRKRSATSGVARTPTTCAVMAPDVADPGLGLITAIATVVPTSDAVVVPVAYSCVLETNVVASGVLPAVTTAPGTKSEPFTTIVYEVGLMAGGVRAVATGIGLRSVAMAFPVTVASVDATASIVTEFGDGRTAGAR